MTQSTNQSTGEGHKRLEDIGRSYVGAWRALSEARDQLRRAERIYREVLHRPLIAVDIERIMREVDEMIEREG